MHFLTHRARRGFTLIELLVVVLIIGILTSIALPAYTRSIERSRATEAMAMVKSINDAVYTFAAQRNQCPTRFGELLISVPGADDSLAVANSKTFEYKLNATSTISGTDCKGVLATRINGGAYNYQIWNPYRLGGGAGVRGLACYGATQKNADICRSLDIYSATAP